MEADGDKATAIGCPSQTVSYSSNLISKFVATYHNLEVMVWVCVMIGLLTSF